MPLHHLLYRCPDCGHDPTTPDAQGTRCGGCGAHFERGEGASIVTNPHSGATQIRTAAQLLDAISDWEERSPGGIGEGGALDHAAGVAFRRVVGQGTVYHDRLVVGFYETFSDVESGTLHVSSEGVDLSCSTRASFEWPWAEVTAVQTSSKSLQLKLKGDGLFDFRFDKDSPRRWEGLMHRGLQAFYGASGERIREFQPRIVRVPIP